MNKRKLFNIASIIIILIYLMVFNYYFYFENKSSFIIPYLFIILIQYIYTIKNKDKYFSLDSVNNVLMFTNISLIFIAIIDFAYDKLLLSFDYGGIFTNLAAIPFVIAYILLIIWLLTLNKEKTKLKKFDIVKIINVVIYIAVVSFGVFNNDGYGYQQYLMVPLILAVIQLFSLLNKNFTRIIQNKYSIILLLTNILLIIGIDSYIFAILASVLSLILIYQYINKKKVLKIIFIIVTILYSLSLTYDLVEKYVIEPLQIKKEEQKKLIEYKKGNEYSKKENYEYVKINYNKVVNNKEELINSIYTFFDSGLKEISIKCSNNYKTCKKDFNKIAKDSIALTYISDFTSPYNHFKHFNWYSLDNEFEIEKTNFYSKNKISKINKEIDKIFNENYDKNKTEEENIKIFHDYIINNTKFSFDYNDAYYLLFNKQSASQGYADVMALLLDKMEIKNIGIVSDKHVWNLVYVNGKWKHLDVAWDDPITEDGKDMIVYDYYLIDDDVLKSYNDDSHSYNEEIYKEFFK